MYNLYLQFKRGRDESGDSDESDGSHESDKEDAMSRHSQQSHQSQHSQHLPGTSSTANSSKSGKSGKAKGNRCEQAPNPLVQLVADSKKFHARILDIIQNMRPTMDPQRQGMMDYTAGVVRKMNEEEWDDFEEQVFPIVWQFAARLHRREKADRTLTPRTMTLDEELGLALQVSCHAPRRPGTQSQPGESGFQGSSVPGSSVQRSSVQGSYGGECSQGWHPMPGPEG
ncbi:uncharacterized protein LOC121389793 [Gigantopelta aegis]|uniref:uncharacterized protein LOC121389793 n=1 Tax=Gigantopelta aegis TaxID=1735272 RepID=UPI001B88D6E6|nr:uncharacterized protein LOC121389793 [Gigantopelta aegis]